MAENYNNGRPVAGHVTGAALRQRVLGHEGSICRKPTNTETTTVSRSIAQKRFEPLLMEGLFILSCHVGNNVGNDILRQRKRDSENHEFLAITW